MIYRNDIQTIVYRLIVENIKFRQHFNFSFILNMDDSS